jgi:hypothetical protein
MRWELHWELLEELGAGAHVDEACWCRVEQTAAVKTGNAVQGLQAGSTGVVVKTEGQLAR